MTTFTIPRQNIGTLRGRIGQLNARAEKLGIEGIAFDEIATYCASAKGLPAAKTAREIVEVEISGGRVGLGWSLLGVIEHTDAGNILRATPGQTIPEAYREVARACAHCGTTRRRKDTFLVESPDGGTILQLGRSCLRDYLGHIDAERLAAWLETIAELIDTDEDGWERGGRGGDDDTLTVIATSATDFRLRGRYLTRAAGADSTGARVSRWMHPGNSKHERAERAAMKAAGFEVTAEDIEAARELRDWVASTTEGGYLGNLRVVAAGETVSDRNIGILISITSAQRSAAERACEQAKRDEAKAERDAEKAADDAKRADAPRGRVEIIGTVERLTTRDGNYGTEYKMIIETDEGWRLWVTQPQSLFDIPEDDGDYDRLRSIIEGERVEMTVTVTPADDDPKFAFGKRPANAHLA